MHVCVIYVHAQAKRAEGDGRGGGGKRRRATGAGPHVRPGAGGGSFPPRLMRGARDSATQMVQTLHSPSISSKGRAARQREEAGGDAGGDGGELGRRAARARETTTVQQELPVGPKERVPAGQAAWAHNPVEGAGGPACPTAPLNPAAPQTEVWGRLDAVIIPRIKLGHDDLSGSRGAGRGARDGAGRATARARDSARG